MNQLDIPDYKYFLGCNAKRTVRITFLIKKFGFHTEICLQLIQIIIFEIFFFDRIKELSKSNQTWYGVSHVYLEYKKKIISSIACLEKSSYFNQKYRLILLFYFKNNRNFFGSKSCSK